MTNRETKPPKNLPQVGDMVKLRGRAPTGKLRMVTPVCNWAEVEWDSIERGPKIVHLWELERLNPASE